MGLTQSCAATDSEAGRRPNERRVRALVDWGKNMTELEAFDAMYGKSYLRTKKPREYAIAWEAWQAATKAEREACCKAIDAIDDGEAPEYRACQEAIRARSNAKVRGASDD